MSVAVLVGSNIGQERRPGELHPAIQERFGIVYQKAVDKVAAFVNVLGVLNIITFLVSIGLEVSKLARGSQRIYIVITTVVNFTQNILSMINTTLGVMSIKTTKASYSLVSREDQALSDYRAVAERNALSVASFEAAAEKNVLAAAKYKTFIQKIIEDNEAAREESKAARAMFEKFMEQLSH